MRPPAPTPPPPPTLEQLAAALGVSVAYLRERGEAYRRYVAGAAGTSAAAAAGNATGESVTRCRS